MKLVKLHFEKWLGIDAVSVLTYRTENFQAQVRWDELHDWPAGATWERLDGDPIYREGHGHLHKSLNEAHEYARFESRIHAIIDIRYRTKSSKIGE